MIHDCHSPLSKEVRARNSHLRKQPTMHVSFWAIYIASLCHVKMFRCQNLYILFTCSSAHEVASFDNVRFLEEIIAIVYLHVSPAHGADPVVVLFYFKFHLYR
jgi:hypothetical protein